MQHECISKTCQVKEDKNTCYMNTFYEAQEQTKLIYVDEGWREVPLGEGQEELLR